MATRIEGIPRTVGRPDPHDDYGLLSDRGRPWREIEAEDRAERRRLLDRARKGLPGASEALWTRYRVRVYWP